MNCALSFLVLFLFTVDTMHRAPTYYVLLFSLRDTIHEILDTNLASVFFLLFTQLANQVTN
jgi:hypothetical protein